MAMQAALNGLRKRHACVRRASFLTGNEASDLTLNGQKLKDISFLYPNGGELDEEAMKHSGGFAMLYSGDPGNSASEHEHYTRRVRGRQHEDPLLVLINPTRKEVEFTLPDVAGVKWKPVFNSIDIDPDDSPKSGNQTIALGWRSIQVFEAQREHEVGHIRGNR